MAGKPATWARGQKRVTLVDLSDGSSAEGVAIVAADGTQITTFGVSGTVTISAPTAIVAFLTANVTAGTRVQLASHAGLQGAVIEAPSTNTGNVYIGGSDVSATVFGAELQPGQSVGIALSNSNLVYFDAATSGDKVAFLGS